MSWGNLEGRLDRVRSAIGYADATEEPSTADDGNETTVHGSEDRSLDSSRHWMHEPTDGDLESFLGDVSDLPDGREIDDHAEQDEDPWLRELDGVFTTMESTVGDGDADRQTTDPFDAPPEETTFEWLDPDDLEVTAEDELDAAVESLVTGQES